jgi:hypothetical protein
LCGDAEQKLERYIWQEIEGPQLRNQFNDKH